MRTKTQPQKRGDIYVPSDSFTANYKGVPSTFIEGKTTVEAPHSLLVTMPHNFRLIRIDYPSDEATNGEQRWEQATNAPGELR